MRRVLTLALGTTCLLASPALAGIALISGTGTGGAQQNLTFNAGTSLGLVTTSSIPAGSLVAVIMQNQSVGTSTGFSCSDTHSNTYSAAHTVTAVANAATQILFSLTGTTINSGDTITCTQTSGPSGIVGQSIAFSGAAATPSDVSAVNSGTAATGTLTVGPTAALACPGGGANCEVLVGAETYATNGVTVTNDSNWTDMAGLPGSSGFATAFWIVSATTARSYSPSTTATTNWAGQIASFKATTSSATTPSGLTTLGVGP